MSMDLADGDIEVALAIDTAVVVIRERYPELDHGELMERIVQAIGAMMRES